MPQGAGRSSDHGLGLVKSAVHPQEIEAIDSQIAKSQARGLETDTIILNERSPTSKKKKTPRVDKSNKVNKDKEEPMETIDNEKLSKSN